MGQAALEAGDIALERLEALPHRLGVAAEVRAGGVIAQVVDAVDSDHAGLLRGDQVQIGIACPQLDAAAADAVVVDHGGVEAVLVLEVCRGARPLREVRRAEEGDAALGAACIAIPEHVEALGEGVAAGVGARELLPAGAQVAVAGWRARGCEAREVGADGNLQLLVDVLLLLRLLRGGFLLRRLLLGSGALLGRSALRDGFGRRRGALGGGRKRAGARP